MPWSCIYLAAMYASETIATVTRQVEKVPRITIFYGQRTMKLANEPGLLKVCVLFKTHVAYLVVQQGEPSLKEEK